MAYNSLSIGTYELSPEGRVQVCTQKSFIRKNVLEAGLYTKRFMVHPYEKRLQRQHFDLNS